MLPVQCYLRAGKTATDLKAELGVNSYEHPALPLVGFKYDQLASPKTHPVVRDCRGIVLERGTWNVVAKSFCRFFNAGEDAENFCRFNWGNFTATEKLDGSLIILYHYAGEWHVNTSGSFGLLECGFSGKNWRELFWEVSGIDRRKLDADLTYVFELWTPHNKVVRAYPRPTAWLLSAFQTAVCAELSAGEVNGLARHLGAPRPEQYDFRSRDEIAEFLRRKAETDKTYEGVVVRDDAGERYKIKSETYLALHHLFDNGNVFNPRRLVPLILAGEVDEVLAYLPEAKPHAVQVQERLADEYAKLLELWRAHKDVPVQKDFALAIVGKSPFTGILFDLRKRLSGEQTENDLREAWRLSGDAIVRKLYG